MPNGISYYRIEKQFKIGSDGSARRTNMRTENETWMVSQTVRRVNQIPMKLRFSDVEFNEHNMIHSNDTWMCKCKQRIPKDMTHIRCFRLATDERNGVVIVILLDDVWNEKSATTKPKQRTMTYRPAVVGAVQIYRGKNRGFSMVANGLRSFLLNVICQPIWNANKSSAVNRSWFP